MSLTDEQLAAMRLRKNRFMGQWTGTSGALAADCHYLMEDRKTMESTIDRLEQEKAALRDAVEARLNGESESCCEGGQCHPQAIADEPASIPVDWILRGEAELKAGREAPRFRGDSIMAAPPDEETPPAEQLLLEALDAVRDRRRRYGPPQDHFAITVALVNAAFGTSFKPKDWATIMQLDKIARSRGPADHPDNNIDTAGYAACRAECP